MAKIIPGEAAVTHAAKLGSHMAERSAANAQARASEAEASRAAANQDPAAWAEAERHKTRRTLGRTAIITGGVLVTVGAIVGTVIYSVNKTADALKPHEISVLEAQASVNKIDLPAYLDSVHADVSASALYHTEAGVPILNAFPGGQSDTAAYSSGTVEMKAATVNDPEAENPKNIVKYITFKVSKAADGTFQASVGLDEQAIKVAYADVSNTLPPNVEAATDGPTRRFVGIFTGSNGGTRENKLIDYTNKYAETKCMPIIQEAYKAGVSNSIRRILQISIPILEQAGDKDGVKVLTEITNNPIPVYIGSPTADIVDINYQAFMPQLPSLQEFAASVDADPNHATMSQDLNGEDCKAAQTAVNDLMRIEQQYNGGQVAVAGSVAQGQGN